MGSSAEPVVIGKISGEEAEKCPICLNTFTTQEVGIPNSCIHTFCCTCLQEWSEVIVKFK
jgi:hypothetical protein